MMSERKGVMCMTRVIVMGIMALLFCSCSNDPLPVFSQHVNFDSSGWDPFMALEFQPYPVDSIVDHDGYDLIVYMRYNRRTKLTELPVEIEEVALDGVLAENPRESLLRIKLVDKNNNPRGRYSHGIYEIADTIARGFKLPAGYAITLSHTLPRSNTSGLMSVGIVMTPVVKNKNPKLFELFAR